MRHLVVVTLITCLFLGITTPSIATTSGHGCAQQVPPGIPGPLSNAPAVSGVIVINEVLLNPHSTWNCSETGGTYFVNSDSWVELYNLQNQPYNLYAAHTTLDSGINTNPYYFPFGAAIPAHGYLVLFPRTNSLFAATETTTLRLIVGSTVVDQQTVPTLGADQSYERTSDGATTWQITSTPTIDASNTSLQITPTSSSGSSRGSTRGSGSGSSTAPGSDSKALVNGVQPNWNKLQFPPTAATDVHTSVSTTLSSPTPSSSSGSLDLVKRIALTLLTLVLALTLFWCWRLFKSA